jgi:hypothetical protein
MLPALLVAIQFFQPLLLLAGEVVGVVMELQMLLLVVPVVEARIANREALETLLVHHQVKEILAVQVVEVQVQEAAAQVL